MGQTPDGRCLVTGAADGCVRLWDVRDARCVRVCAGHSGPVLACAVTPDGLLAVTTSADRRVRMWNLQTGDCVAVFCSDGKVKGVSEIRAHGVFACAVEGREVVLFSPRNLGLGLPVVTASRLWTYGEKSRAGRWEESLGGLCEWCGQRFPVPQAVVDAIGEVIRQAGGAEHESPCLRMQREAWEDSRLRCCCPHCHGELRFNPFINDTSLGLGGLESNVDASVAARSQPRPALAPRRAPGPDPSRGNPNAQFEQMMRRRRKP
ncbi:MAG: hypothetical protein HY814_07795 [Candidatus Riflebacteria bacterium]|nr:hypothetical protein [Candidatus Riflebacteria bacterium]